MRGFCESERKKTWRPKIEKRREEEGSHRTKRRREKRGARLNGASRGKDGGEVVEGGRDYVHVTLLAMCNVATKSLHISICGKPDEWEVIYRAIIPLFSSAA